MTRVVFVGEMYNADLSVGGGPIYPGAPQPPLGIWGPTDPRPTHPIAGYPWPQPPPSGGGPVDPGYSPPWARPPVDPGYSPPWARPQPPYVDNTLPQPPLGIWGGGNVPMPNPPIYFPPSPGTPEHPIVLPPDLPPTTPEGRPIEWKTGWTAATGWIVVGIPQVPVPTPA